MVNVHLMSDLHMDFTKIRDHRAPPGTDVVVLAGDTHPGVLGLMWAAETFPDLPVIMVPGNHEYYGKRAIDRHGRKMQEKAEALNRETGSRVHMLDRGEVVLSGTRFLCATLWTDYALYGLENREKAMRDAEREMNDYRNVCSTLNRRLTAAFVLGEHRKSRAWLEERLAVPFDGPTVVVTHHPPTPRALPPGYRGDSVSPCYASDLEALMQGPTAPEAWFHGHVHVCHDHVVGGTRVVANPRGYVEWKSVENPLFDPGLLLRIERRPEPVPLPR